MFLMLKYKTHQTHVEDIKNEVLLDLIAGIKIFRIRKIVRIPEFSYNTTTSI